MSTTPTPSPAVPEGPGPSLADFLDRVRDTNPFLVNRVDRPLADDQIDVERVNEVSFRKLLDLARQAREQDRGIGVVLWGEAGVGKSHLLARLRRWARKDSQGCPVYLHNLQASPERLPRYVLKCVISFLTHGFAPPLHRTPLFELVNAAVRQALDQEGIARPTWSQLEAAYQHWLDRQSARDPSGGVLFNRTVYHVLYRFFAAAYPHPRGPDETTARLALRWLSGDPLEAGEARKVGLRGARPEALVALPDNQAVKQVLVALARLALVRRQPFLLCFDQADNLDEDQVRALSRFLHDLLDSAGNVLVVTAGVRQTLLGYHRRGVVTETSWQRLGQFDLTLGRLLPAEGRLILEGRLQAFLRPFLGVAEVRDRVREDSLFPLGRTWFEQRLRDLVDFRPRDLLTWAGERWLTQQERLAKMPAAEWLGRWAAVDTTPPPPTLPQDPKEIAALIDRKVDERVAAHKEQRLREPARTSPGEDQLSELVQRLLRQCQHVSGPCSLLEVRKPAAPKGGKRPTYDLMVRLRQGPDGREVRKGLRFLVPDHPLTATAALRSLVEDPEPPDQVFLVTDERQPLAPGARGNEYLEELLRRGRAKFQHLELIPEQYAEMDALQAVVVMARGGNLEVELPSGQVRKVTEQEVVESHHRQQRYLFSPLFRELFPAGGPRLAPVPAAPAG